MAEGTVAASAAAPVKVTRKATKPTAMKKASPKKEASKSAKTISKSAGLSTERMILLAIEAEKNPKGYASRPAINKHLHATLKVEDTKMVASRVKRTLKRMVEKKILIQSKGSFKINPEFKKPKKTTPKPKAVVRKAAESKVLTKAAKPTKVASVKSDSAPEPKPKVTKRVAKPKTVKKSPVKATGVTKKAAPSKAAKPASKKAPIKKTTKAAPKASKATKA